VKESVRTSKHPWLVGIVMVAIGGAYFALLGQSGFQEPAASVKYDVQSYRDVDKVETTYDETGEIDPGMASPHALSVGVDGKIYVGGENEIVVFGSGDRELNRFAIEGRPECMAVAENGFILVGYSDHVEVLNAQGSVESVWDSPGTRPSLTSIAVYEGDVYVGDGGNKVVWHYDMEGRLLGEIGKKNEAEDIPGIQAPSAHVDLAINDEGDLWIVNPGMGGLERYRSDGSIVTSWYRQNLTLEGFSGCCNPTHVAFRGDGKLITAEKGLVRVKVWDVTHGDYEDLVAGTKVFPREQSLWDIVVDTRDRILALDPRSDTIRIFEEKESSDG